MAGAADIDWLAYQTKTRTRRFLISNLMKLRIHHWYLLVCHSLQKSNAKTTYTPLIVPSITRKRQMGWRWRRSGEELDRETEHKLLCSIRKYLVGQFFQRFQRIMLKAFSKLRLLDIKLCFVIDFKEKFSSTL